MTDDEGMVYAGVDVLEQGGVEYFVHVWHKNGGAEVGRTRELTKAQQRDELLATGVRPGYVDAWMLAARDYAAVRRTAGTSLALRLPTLRIGASDAHEMVTEGGRLGSDGQFTQVGPVQTDAYKQGLREEGYSDEAIEAFL